MNTAGTFYIRFPLFTAPSFIPSYTLSLHLLLLPPPLPLFQAQHSHSHSHSHSHPHSHSHLHTFTLACFPLLEGIIQLGRIARCPALETGPSRTNKRFATDSRSSGRGWFGMVLPLLLLFIRRRRQRRRRQRRRSGG